MKFRYYFDKIFNTVHLINEIDDLTQRLDIQIKKNKQLQNMVDDLSKALKDFHPIVSITRNICNPFIEEENEQFIITVGELHVSFKIYANAPSEIKNECFKQALKDLGGMYLSQSIERFNQK